MAMGADQKFDWAASVSSMMDWWREAGLDVAIAEEPRNWLQPVAENSDLDARRDHAPRDTGEPENRPPPAARAAPPPPSAPARIIAAMPADLAAFEAWRLGDEGPDSGWAGPRLGSQGQAQSGMMVIIEMPERDDGAAGTLLSGATGALFDRMLAAIGRDRQSIYLVPMCVVRPSTGSIPPDDLPALAAALRHQVMLAAPRRVLVIGNAVSRALLGADIADMRGALRPINRNDGQQVQPIEAVASYHPRFLLERSAAKAEAWKDLLLFAQGIDA